MTIPAPRTELAPTWLEELTRASDLLKSPASPIGDRDLSVAVANLLDLEFVTARHCQGGAVNTAHLTLARAVTVRAAQNRLNAVGAGRPPKNRN